jgi:hypothetical protein
MATTLQRLQILLPPLFRHGLIDSWNRSSGLPTEAIRAATLQMTVTTSGRPLEFAALTTSRRNLECEPIPAPALACGRPRRSSATGRGRGRSRRRRSGPSPTLPSPGCPSGLADTCRNPSSPLSSTRVGRLGAAHPARSIGSDAHTVGVRKRAPSVEAWQCECERPGLRRGAERCKFLRPEFRGHPSSKLPAVPGRRRRTICFCHRRAAGRSRTDAVEANDPAAADSAPHRRGNHRYWAVASASSASRQPADRGARDGTSKQDLGERMPEQRRSVPAALRHW